MLTTEAIRRMMREALDNIQSVIYKPTGDDYVAVAKAQYRVILLVAQEYLDNFLRPKWGEHLEEALTHAIAIQVGLSRGMSDADKMAQFGGEPTFETVTGNKVSPEELEITW